jgi:isopentenyl diphosphate isomerase/L-lactate dehydrogenase-like FMN-dependent dehydrogenase
MYAKDIIALDNLELLPRVIHDSDEVNPSWTGLDLELPGPLWAEVPANWSGRITSRREDALGSIWLAPPVKMKLLVPMMREARDLGAIATGVDFSALAADLETRPRSASELSELKIACGLPFVVAGLLDPRDAERSAEAGADAIIASSSLSAWLGGPSLVALIPDLRDAVGDILLFAKGAVRNGADVLRYLALGVDAVVLPGALNPHQMLEELSRAMRVTGCNTLDEISYDLIFEPTFD